MAKVNVIDKKVEMLPMDIIRFQLLTHFFIHKVPMSESEVSCLSLLGSCGESELAEFCNAAVVQGVFKTSQTVRNFLTKAEKEGIVVKIGKSRKKISLNPELKIVAGGNILLNLKAYCLNGS
jgi:hypothetical protein